MKVQATADMFKDIFEKPGKLYSQHLLWEKPTHLANDARK